MANRIFEARSAWRVYIRAVKILKIVMYGFIFLSVSTLFVICSWIAFIILGKKFALRDHLEKADAIVVLSGTRGNIEFLDGKIQTASRLYFEKWGPNIIACGRFSQKVTDTPKLISPEDLHQAVKEGRIQPKDLEAALTNWDEGLGATYIANQLVDKGVPEAAIIEEGASLHTRENAEFTLPILESHHFRKIILVTSPFHQLRSYCTFKKVMQGKGIKIINYYADTTEWHPFTWFFSAKNRALVKGERKRIQEYGQKWGLA